MTLKSVNKTVTAGHNVMALDTCVKLDGRYLNIVEGGYNGEFE